MNPRPAKRRATGVQMGSGRTSLIKTIIIIIMIITIMMIVLLIVYIPPTHTHETPLAGDQRLGDEHLP